jgi:hypothetical protein
MKQKLIPVAGGIPTGPYPEDRDIDVAEERSWVLAREEVEGDGGNERQ